MFVTLWHTIPLGHINQYRHVRWIYPTRYNVCNRVVKMHFSVGTECA